MKYNSSPAGAAKVFLSDLCGREVLIDGDRAKVNFLSDLCGREVVVLNVKVSHGFLSDLCGREEASQQKAFCLAFSKRPVRS